MNNSIKIKWFPPSWVQIKTRRHLIYIDPAYLKTNFARYPKRIEYSTWPDPIDGLPEELEKGDLILITHPHKDHCKSVTINRLKGKKTKILATRPCARELGKDILMVTPGMEIKIEDMTVKTVEAYNQKRPGKDKLMHKKGIGVGYLLSVEGKNIYHAGDTDLIPEMEEIKDIDLAFLPIGGRGFTMDLSEAIQAARRIRPKMIIPIHRFGSDPEVYKKSVEKETATRVKVLEIGETYRL